MNERMARIDLPLFTAILLMLGFGLVLVYSSSFAIAQQRYGGADFYLARQASRALMALVSFAVFINVDYHVWGKLNKVIFLGSIVLLVTVLLLPDSQAINGAKRWITLGPIRFQVSDFGRTALVILLASECDRYGAELKNWNVLVKLLIKIGIICGLIVLEPDFSTTIVIAIIACAILFVNGARLWHLGGLALSAIPLGVMLVMTTPYRMKRILGYLEMSDRKGGTGYQAYQSLIGLGNGGLFGVGLGKGEQKFFYLPEPHTDFIFAIIGEEIGFIGLLLVLSVFTFIVVRGLRIAMNAPDRMGQSMAFGFSIVLSMYVLVHACVSTGLVPTTGVPLPFLSYGGVSLIITMSTMGILLNISSQSRSSGPVFASVKKKGAHHK